VLNNVYDSFERTGSTEVLIHTFGLKRREDVLVDYVAVPCAHLLEQVPGGSTVLYNLGRLLDKTTRGANVDERRALLDKVLLSAVETLKDKKGVFRQLCVPVRRCNSARAVIVCDPHIPLESIGVPITIAKVLTSDIDVTHDNVHRCVSLIADGIATHIAYNKQRCRILSTHVTLTVTFRGDNSLCSNVDIEYGDVVTVTRSSGKESHVYSRSQEHVVTHLLDSSRGCTVCVTREARDKQARWKEDDGVVVPPSNDWLYSVYVRVASKQHRASTQQQTVPRAEATMSHLVMLQTGCIVTAPIDGAHLLVHRNPVLSASSIHNHRMSVTQTGRHATLAPLELLQQRHNVANYPRRMLVADKLPLRYDHNPLYISFRRHDLATTKVGTYKMASTFVSIVERHLDVDCVLAINPVAATPYGADFDGDEMNVSTLPSSVTFSSPLQHYERSSRKHRRTYSAHNVSLLGDLFKGSYGPIHDGRYGLHCVLTDRVGLSKLTSQYALVVRYMLSQRSVPFDVRTLCDCGLDVHEAETVFELYARSNAMTRRDVDAHTDAVYAVVVNITQHVDACHSNVSCTSFMCELRLHESRRSMKGHNAFNEFFSQYVGDERNVELLLHDYANEKDDQRLLSRFYADVMCCLYKLCDHSGLYYSTRDVNNSKRIVESGARTKQATFDAIYNSVGFITYVTPHGTDVDYVKGNFRSGVSQDEYVSLCYSNRVQAVNKAERTAPEGDNMRLQCNYMSDVYNKEDVWYVRDKPVYTRVDGNTIDALERRVDERTQREYRYVLDNTFLRMSYKEVDDMTMHERRDRQKLLHVGQRKLLMAEIEFLTERSRKGDVVVYAGAASGLHIPTLLLLFPHVEMHLYDAARFSRDLYNKVSGTPAKGLTIYKKYLTVEICKERYGTTKDEVLFISDIRTNSNMADNEEDSHPLDADVTRDNLLNMSLVAALLPRHCCLKFRLPYDDGVTVLPEGELRLQCWQRRSSTEVRLHCSFPYVAKEYSNREHEERMAYHNTLRTKEVTGRRVNKHLLKLLRDNGIAVCYDAYRESHIVEEYCRKYNKQEKHVYECIGQSLSVDLSYYKERSNT
jgi:hypothetical protein